MKYFLLVLLLAVQVSRIDAQKQDNVWVFGYDYNPGDGLSECTQFAFGDSLIITNYQRPMELLNSNAMISDSAGNLLLLSNGCYASKADGTKVKNSDGMNPGSLYDLFCTTSSGYNIKNSILLPDPGKPSVYHIFHLPSDDYFYAFMQSSFDLLADGGAGATLFKNKALVPDTIHPDGLHAVRHANGRDWWVMAAELFSNRHYLLLLTPQGVTIKQQAIGEPTWSQAGGNIVFSPDGTKMARFNARDDLRVFDFDRCTGELSNPIYVKMIGPGDNQLTSGLAWSADSRYIYAQENRVIYQFDVLSSDLVASQTIAAEWDPVARCPFTVEFGYIELGPDGRIYCRPSSGQNCMHRMQHPERVGTACNMQLSYFNFTYPYKNLPHFPNFRLGPVDGSPCDTLGLDNHPLAGWRHDPVGGLAVDFTSVSWYEPTAWLWDFGDGQQSAERNPAHTFPKPGQYDVCLTVSNAQGSDTKCKKIWVTKTVGVGEPWVEGGVVLWPNPASEILTIQYSNSGEASGWLIANPYGQIMQRGEWATGATTTEVDISKLPSGSYFFRLQVQGGRSSNQLFMVLRE